MRIVNGVGPARAKIALVGEAPGEKEDLAGVPFVGRAGKFLDSVLSKSGLERQDLFVSNIVRCRPPENRKPRTDEMESCLPYLLEELKIARPAVVVAMGSAAITALTGIRGKIGPNIGKKIEICSGDFLFTVIPCYHPSAAMRNRVLREKFEKVIASLAKID